MIENAHKTIENAQERVYTVMKRSGSFRNGERSGTAINGQERIGIGKVDRLKLTS
jgi:hypothetical protein